MKRMLGLSFCVGSTILFWGSICVAEDRASIESLRTSYKQTDGFSLDFRDKETLTRSKDGATASTKRVIVVRKDGNRWSVLSKETGDAWLLPKSVERSTCQELIMDGSQGISIRAQSGKNYRGKRYSNAEMVPLPAEANEMSLVGSIDGSPPYQQLNPQDYLEVSQFILGYVDPWTFLPDVLAGATKAEGVSVQIPNSLVVEKVGPKGKVTAWLDTQNGFLPRRVEHQRKQGDILGENDILGQIPAQKPGRIWPAAKLIATDLVIDRIEIEKLGDRPITTNFRTRFKYKYIDGQELLVSNEVAGSNLGKSGRAAFSPTIVIPDGTHVQVDSTPQINYVWRGGQIEPEVTPGILGRFEAGIRRGGSSRRPTVIGLVVVTALILGVIGFAWRRRNK